MAGGTQQTGTNGPGAVTPPALPSPTTTPTTTPPASPLGGTASTALPTVTTEPGDPTSIIGATETETTVAPFEAEKLALPDGYERGENFDAFAGVMKEFGVSQEKAQELVGLHAKSIEAALKSLRDDWTQKQQEWQGVIKTDPEIGGRNFEGVKQTISKVLDNVELTDPGFREAMDFTGAGNNPAIVRTIYRWAKALSEGSELQGGAPERNRDGSLNGDRPSAAQAMYPGGPHTGGPKLNG